jgi:hypothetical protein
MPGPPPALRQLPVALDALAPNYLEDRQQFWHAPARSQRAPRFPPKSPASEYTNPVKFGKEGPVVVPLSTTFSAGGLIP